MKKLFILFVAVAMTALSTEVFAQSKGTSPAPGATHNYYITDNSASGNSVLWTVTKGDLSDPAGDDAVIEDNDAYNTNITWAAGLTVGDWYFVHVVESDGTCTNEKVLPVQITASPFYLTLAAAEDEQCYDGAVSVSLDLTDINNPIPKYDHGNATLVFTVTPAGLSDSYEGYEFVLEIDVPDGYDATPAFSDNASIDNNSTVSVDDNDAVTITYTVDNTTVLTNATDPDGDGADFTATVTISNGIAVNGVSDNAEGNYADDTEVSRPHTSGIGTD